jgi:hypothetical protein
LGEVPLCSAKCFLWAARCGWFDADYLWAKQNKRRDEGATGGHEVMVNNRDFPNSGILFKNEKRRNDRDPGYQGSVDITCPDCARRFQMWISAWVKEGRKGKFFSLSFKAKDSATKSSLPGEPADDDLSF